MVDRCHKCVSGIRAQRPYIYIIPQIYISQKIFHGIFFSATYSRRFLTLMLRLRDTNPTNRKSVLLMVYNQLCFISSTIRLLLFFKFFLVNFALVENNSWQMILFGLFLVYSRVIYLVSVFLSSHGAQVSKISMMPLQKCRGIFISYICLEL